MVPAPATYENALLKSQAVPETQRSFPPRYQCDNTVAVLRLHLRLTGEVLIFDFAFTCVLLVRGSEFDHCDSMHPLFFSNDGNIVYQFDCSRFFYFISGVSGHCKRGQKMIVRVMSPKDDDSHSFEGASIHGIPKFGLFALLLVQIM
ncbi:hypothetical protein NE237_016696 [Protea cynaroides]|uniref:Phytocyanin domain-containing protein n=1 Tax=Protea cynaroides TaxID=273540 RepID=A0A9Q0K6J1_9MAGN|nr:hypothetical protein NE237_016696 [Protea cynaroides]